jgi:phosphoesterase RecJ-like protein
MFEELPQIKQVLSQSKKIAIIIHRNPDGDAIGSGLALKEFLENNKHKVALFSPNEVPEYLKWLPSTNDVIVFDEKKQDVKDYLEDTDLIFTLDFNDFSRTGKDFEKVLKSLTDKSFVMIDHHLEPSCYAKYMFSDHHKSSTSEMVYEFMVSLSNKSAISKNMATCLYTGIMTDTGSFKFPNTTANTMRIAADLMEKGINHNQIQIKIYDSFTTDKLHLLGEALNKLVFLPEYKTAYIVLSKADLKKHHYKKGDTEGFVNYGLSLADSNFAVMFLENDDEGVRISFRSKGNFPANEFAKRYFNGGGHLNAAGGRTTQSLSEAVSLFLEKLPEFKEKLLATNV